MSHIDEGELTAYADGAYPLEDADGQVIAAHLAECANCRNRLAHAQMLSGRASEILAVAAPASMAAPPFEQISANITPRRRARAVPLSWAASIVLAVGLGWFGRDALYEPDAGLKVTASPESRSDRAAEVQAPESQAEPPAATPGLTTAPAGPREVSPTQGRLGSGARGDARGAASVAAGNEAVQDAVEEPMAAAAPAPTAQIRQTEERAEAGAAVGRVAAPPSAPQPEMAKAIRARTQNMAAADLAATGSINYITAAEAEERKLVLHIVPELEIVRIGLTDAGVTVEQKLPDGRIVTLTSTPERPSVARESDATVRKSVGGIRAEAASATATMPVVVTRGSMRVTISGALPADSLRALGAKVR